MRTTFSIFGQYISKGSIEFDSSLVISFKDIHESLIQTMTYEEIRACKDESDEEVSLIDL